MMASSTTPFAINGDRSLSPLKLKFWDMICRYHNRQPRSCSPRIDIQKFRIDETEIPWEVSDPKSSPSRLVGDLFWHSILQSEDIAPFCPLHIVDCGCGSGAPGFNIMNQLDHRAESYLGFDHSFNERWQELETSNPKMKFKHLTSGDLSSVLDNKTNAVFSQSALEHFDNDVEFMKALYKHVSTISHDFLQIHLLPSAETLELYRPHGYRQYTPRLISSLTQPFLNEKNQITLYSLGGHRSNRIHKEFITEPLNDHRKQDLRNTDAENYTTKRNHALIEDMNDNDIHSSSFYALVIQTKANQPS